MPAKKPTNPIIAVIVIYAAVLFLMILVFSCNVKRQVTVEKIETREKENSSATVDSSNTKTEEDEYDRKITVYFDVDSNSKISYSLLPDEKTVLYRSPSLLPKSTDWWHLSANVGAYSVGGYVDNSQHNTPRISRIEIQEKGKRKSTETTLLAKKDTVARETATKGKVRAVEVKKEIFPTRVIVILFILGVIILLFVKYRTKIRNSILSLIKKLP